MRELQRRIAASDAGTARVEPVRHRCDEAATRQPPVAPSRLREVRAKLCRSVLHIFGVEMRVEIHRHADGQQGSLSVIGTRDQLGFTWTVGDGLASDRLNWPCGSCWFWSADLECLGRGRANKAILGGCDFDEPRTGLSEADGALRGPLVRLLVGGDFAGAARGSGGAGLEAPVSVRGGGDGVGHVLGAGEANGDALVGSACA